MATARGAPPGFFPLDRELDLVPGSPWSAQARQIIVRLGTEVPFERGPALVALLTGMQVSASTIRTLTEAAGATLVAVEEAERERITRTMPAAPMGASAQQVSVDGAMVPLVGGVWREVRTLVVGAIEPTETGNRKARALSYLSRMTDAETFSEVAIIELHRRGTEHARVAAIADGAGWCQQFFDDHVPTAVRILDFPHAVEHLSTVAQAVFGSGTAATSEWLGTQRAALRDGDPDDVLVAIAALPVASASDPAAAQIVRDRELAYFTTRREQIAYATFVAAGLPIGSGAVESANKLVVEERLKGAGMHWSADHVDAMLALRCALCSTRWDDAWTALTTFQPPRRPPSLPPRPPARPDAPTPALPHRPAAPPMIVNGKPTMNHPWKQGFRARNAVASTKNR